jgi:chromate transporter
LAVHFHLSHGNVIHAINKVLSGLCQFIPGRIRFAHAPVAHRIIGFRWTVAGRKSNENEKDKREEYDFFCYLPGKGFQVGHEGAKIGKLRRWSFLKAVFYLGCTAFGGPQMHIPYFIRRLVEQKKFCDKQTLLDINAFCSILPGPSTTQTITALGFKLGGPRLALLSLLAWLLPGAIVMTFLTVSPKFLGASHLRFLPAMVAAFLCYAVISMSGFIQKGMLNYFIFLVVGILGAIVQSPWLFPIAIIAGGFATANFGEREYVPNDKPFGKIRLANLTLYFSIFVIIGAVGIIFNKNEKLMRIGKPVILFENTYRMGSLSFGGGNSMAAMAVDQYANPRKNSPRHRMSLDELNIGLGLTQGLPGPNFNFAVYLNGIAMKNLGYNFPGQLAGCIIGMVAIFLPGTLLIFFAFPVWDRIKTYPVVQRSLDGILAASVGFILSAALILNFYFWNNHSSPVQYPGDYAIFGLTLLALFSKRIPSPILVIGTILAGVIIPL